LIFLFCLDIPVYIQSKDESDFSSLLSTNVTFLNLDFLINEKDFQTLSPNSVVILDDYSFNKSKQSKTDFLHVVNYYLRHFNVTLFLIIHNLYSSGLLNEILLAPHIFLAYSNLGYYIIKKLQQRLGGPNVMHFWQEPPRFNYHFCYINCNRNYLINYVDKLFLGDTATMFVNHHTYVIHSKDQFCEPNVLPNAETSAIANTLEKEVKDYLSNAYPKNKNIHFIANILLRNNLLNQTLFFDKFPKIHLADFFAFINNRFEKHKPNVNIVKLCKYLQKENIKFPRVTIKNVSAQKMLT